VRIHVIGFEYCTIEPWLASLDYLARHDVSVTWYTRETPCDHIILNDVFAAQPDIILYTGMADWDKTPSLSTFRRLRKYAPIVHISGDLSDPPYDPYLKRYGEDGTFDLTVNIDGNDEWNRHGAKGITLLSPTAPQFFDAPKPLADRPIEFGFAGGLGSPSRREIVDFLVREAGLVVKPYDNRWGSYADYARFLMDCKIVLNIPFSGSDAVRQVKGRVLEAGLAGCVLLDHVESAAKHWFNRDLELCYLEYDTPKRAAEQVRFLLQSGIADEAAANLARRVREEHSPDKFWNRVFSEVGL
jgi:hypothetical protein